MDEGSYNNVIRTNSPFSPMTPSTPSGTSYKANVNRTKTRKWVEAKAQNYDGDDWGYDSYDDEPEVPPSPPKPTGFRQLGRTSQTRPPPDARPSDFLPSSRTFSQPSPADPPEPALGPRSPSVPPVLQRPTPPTSTKPGPIQASSGMVPDSASQSGVPGRNVDEQVSSAQSADAHHNGQPSGYPGRSSPASSATGQVPSLYPPRKSSMSRGSQQEGRDTDSPAHAAGNSGAPPKASPFVRPADFYRRMGEKENERHSMESGRPSMDSTLRSNLPPVAERKSEYGMDRLLTESHKEHSRESLRRLPPSPKLPEVSRMSGFGDDLFSNSIRYSSGVAPSLPAVADGQSTTTPRSPTSEPQYSSEVSGPGLVLREPSSMAAADDRKEMPESFTQPAWRQPTSTSEGPKLEANPDIVTPPSDEQAQRGSSSTINTPGQQPKSSRPHLPGGWVSETSALGSAQPTPTELSQPPQPAPTVDTGNSQASPVTSKAGAPDDLEPTTTVKNLPPTDNPKEAADVRATLESGRDGFNRPAGEHDDAVGSELITSGTGHHPTPHSLPALKTENALDLRNPPEHHKQRYPPESTTGPPSGNQWTMATMSSAFAPAGPLNHTGPSLAQPEQVVDGRPRQSTMSTVETVSPAKESDKLREEIMKSLSLDPLTPQSSSGFLGNPSPSEQEIPRESRYLSGVYDDYLALVEDKSPQELGQALKNESMVAGHATTEAKQGDEPTHQADSSIPEVQPLSSRKTPEPEPTKRPRRFSWEQSSEQLTGSPVETRPAGEATPRESGVEEKRRAQSPAMSDPNPCDDTAGGPVSQSEGTGTLSQELTKPGGYRGETLGSPASEQSSPISIPTDNPARGTATDVYANSAEGKILIEPSSHPVLAPSPMEHPALSKPLEPSPSIAPISAGTPATPTSQQPKIMAFREILNLPSSDQRTQKFDETRNQFFSMDSGLSYWLLHMSGHLEQTSMTSPGDPQQTSSTAQAQSSPVGPPGKVSTGNFMGQPGSTTSGFNTGNQVGARASAQRSDRDSRRRAVGSRGPHHVYSRSPSSLTALLLRIRHGNVVNQAPVAQEPPRALERIAQGFQQTVGTTSAARFFHVTPVALATDHHITECSVTTGAAAYSFIAALLLEGDNFDSKPGYKVRRTTLPAPAATSSVAAHNAPELTVDRVQQKMTAPMAANGLNSPTFGDAAMQKQPGSPARSTSFVGLPPIRRASAIDLSSKAKKSAADNDDSIPPRLSTPDNETPPLPAMPAGLGLQSPNGESPGRVHKDHIAFHASPSRSTHSAQSDFQQSANGGQEPHDRGLSPPPQRVPDALIPGWDATRQRVAHLGFSPKAQQVLGNGMPSGRQPPFGQVPAQQGGGLMNGKSHELLSQSGGNPIQKLPPGGRWKLEESHLSEPLISPKQNRSGSSPPMQQPSHFAYDKETGMSVPVPGPSQPPQRQKNNSIPPISAKRFPGLFADPHRPSPQSLPQDQEQAYKAQPPVNALPRAQTNETAEHTRKGSASGLFKEIGGRFSRSRGNSAPDARAGPVGGDEVSEPSISSEDTRDEPRNHAQSEFGPSEKKRPFFGSAANTSPTLSKPRSSLNLVRTATAEVSLSQDHAGGPDGAVKKRLSDFRGILKGNSSVKDDQPAKSTTVYATTSSSQGSGQAQGIQRPQGIPGFPGSHTQQKPLPVQTPPAFPTPRPPPPVPTTSKFSIDSRNSTQDDREKRSGGNFFSNLFGNKSKAQEHKPQPKQADPQVQGPGQFPTAIHPGQQPGPGQMPPYNQQFAGRQMYPYQSPPQQVRLGQQGLPQPITGGAVPSKATSGQGGHLAHARHFSQSPVAQQGQPGASDQQQHFSQSQQPPMPPQQASQSSQTPPPEFDPLHSNPVSPSQQPVDGLAAAGAALNESPKSSQHSPQDRLSMGEPSAANRVSPNRKPVGSGPSKPEGTSTTSAPGIPAATQPNTAASNAGASVGKHDPTSRMSPKDDGPASQPSPAQKASQFGTTGHIRQPSLPSPAQSPPPQEQSPGPVSQQRLPTASDQQMSPTPSSKSQPPVSQVNREEHGEASNAPQGQLGEVQRQQQHQEKPGEAVSPVSSADIQHNPQMTGALPASHGQTLQPRPSQQFLRSHSPQAFPSPTPSQENHISPSTLFESKTKTTVQASPAQPDDREKSTKSRLFSAFKRNKQTEAQKPQIIKPQPNQQGPPHVMRSGMPGHMGQPGQPFPGQYQAMPPGFLARPGQQPQGPMQPSQGRGQMVPFQSLPPHIQAQMLAGRGHMPPQMQAGRGQMSTVPMVGGRGQVPGQGPGGPGQPPSQRFQSSPQMQPQAQFRQSSQQPGEPQYAPVPIPAGYQAVHGYNVPSVVAPSPYDIGRPSASPPPAHPDQQYHGIPPPHRNLAQQWNPGMAPNAQAIPPGSQLSPQFHPTPQPYGPQTAQNQVSPQQPQPQPQANTIQSLNSPPGHPQVETWRGPQQPRPSPGEIASRAQSAQSQSSEPTQHSMTPSDATSQVDKPNSAGEGAQQARQGIPAMSAPKNDTQGSRQLSPLSPVHSVAKAAEDPNLANRALSDLGRVSSEAARAYNSHHHDGASSVAEHPKSMSLSPEVPHDRTLSVSPEPSGPHPPLVQQVSTQSMNINIERANQYKPGATEDIYDSSSRNAPPASSASTSPLPPHPHRPHHPAGPPAAAGLAAGAGFAVAAGMATGVVTAGAAIQQRDPEPPEQQPGFYDPSHANATAANDYPDDSKPLPRPAPVEPEEKILVDQPVELAAVKDDDDGIPVMTATSYPGQEWNPYGAGEFGDWD
ncbi:hypothetical protein DL769_008601 [Monosporascus sp. CRB-8-3]|nr:hypothetical protein DL769_008601 [Monosporascus sp. CRB-8-3]